jgi:hypothetical protein
MKKLYPRPNQLAVPKVLKEFTLRDIGQSYFKQLHIFATQSVAVKLSKPFADLDPCASGCTTRYQCWGNTSTRGNIGLGT